MWGDWETGVVGLLPVFLVGLHPSIGFLPCPDIGHKGNRVGERMMEVGMGGELHLHCTRHETRGCHVIQAHA